MILEILTILALIFVCLAAAVFTFVLVLIVFHGLFWVINYLSDNTLNRSGPS